MFFIAGDKGSNNDDTNKNISLKQGRNVQKNAQSPKSNNYSPKLNTNMPLLETPVSPNYRMPLLETPDSPHNRMPLLETPVSPHNRMPPLEHLPNEMPPLEPVLSPGTQVTQDMPVLEDISPIKPVTKCVTDSYSPVQLNVGNFPYGTTEVGFIDIYRILLIKHIQGTRDEETYLMIISKLPYTQSKNRRK